MATRFYFSKIAPNVLLHAPMVGTWAGGFLTTPQSPVQWTWTLVTTKVNAGAKFSPTLSTNQQGDFDALFAEWRTRPLDAQTISGTFDLCVFASALWLDGMGSSPDTVARLKVHCYISVGQSRTVRATLLDNYVDSVDFSTGSTTWQSLAAAQTLASAAAQDGDCVVIEVGVRVVSSPTPAPTYPPSANSSIQMQMTGVITANADATAGSLVGTLNAWCEFSHTFTFQPLPAAPANETCAAAIPIAALPYQSAEIDCSQATGTQRETFWSFTAPTSGRMVFHNFGSNFGTDIDLFANCALGAAAGTLVTGDNTLATHRSQTCLVWDVAAGSTYIARVRNSTQTFNAVSGGGIVKLGAYYVAAPAVDDLYLPSGVIAMYRDGQQVNVNPDFTDSVPSGVAIDYTQRPLADLNGGTSTAIRLLVGLFSFKLVEILDATTLNAGESEIDFIGDGWGVAASIPGLAQLYITAAGVLYAGWFGNGFLYVLGTGTSRPAFLNTISSDPDFSALKIIDATHGDTQPGAPFTAARQFPSAAPTSPWALQLDETSSILYYTSGGVYQTLAAQTIRRFNVSTAAQLADFATLPSGGGFNPDVKGMVLLADRSLLVCNATQVVKLSAAGAVLATYTPSNALNSRSLIDVKLTADQRYFWVVDLWTTTLFKFDLVTGLEVGMYPTYLRPGSLVQMALYNPAGQPPPPAPVTVCPPVSWLAPATPGCVAIGEL